DSVGPLGVPQDTNNDGAATTPAPGDWGSIVLGGRLSNDQDNLIPQGQTTPNAQAVPGGGTTGTVLGADGNPLPGDLDPTQGSYIPGAMMKFGSKIRLQSGSKVPAFGQEEFFRSAVISHNQIYNFSEFGVEANLGIYRNPTSNPPSICGPGGQSPPCI